MSHSNINKLNNQNYNNKRLGNDNMNMCHGVRRVIRGDDVERVFI